MDANRHCSICLRAPGYTESDTELDLRYNTASMQVELLTPWLGVRALELAHQPPLLLVWHQLLGHAWVLAEVLLSAVFWLLVCHHAQVAGEVRCLLGCFCLDSQCEEESVTWSCFCIQAGWLAFKDLCGRLDQIKQYIFVLNHITACCSMCYPDELLLPELLEELLPELPEDELDELPEAGDLLEGAIDQAFQTLLG